MIILGAVILAVVVSAVYIWFPRPAHSASIITPRDHATVCYADIVTGISRGISRDEHLWLIVKPLARSLSYPQPGPVTSTGANDGRDWRGEAFFGIAPGASGRGDVFALSVVVASGDANRALLAYVDQLNEHPEGGLVDLPAGATIRQTVIVTRASC